MELYISHSGTYNESNITINTNMNIIGESQKNTIIDGQQSGNSIFNITSGVERYNYQFNTNKWNDRING